MFLFDHVYELELSHTHQVRCRKNQRVAGDVEKIGVSRPLLVTDPAMYYFYNHTHISSIHTTYMQKYSSPLSLVTHILIHAHASHNAHSHTHTHRLAELSMIGESKELCDRAGMP